GARLRVAELQLVDYAEADLQAAWEALLRELHGFTPWLAPAARGRVFLTLGTAEARQLAEALDAHAGSATSCELAELAALASRAGECRAVPEGGEEAFLARLPLRFLRGVGLGKRALERLSWLGLRTVAELRAWRRAQLAAYLGAEAAPLLPY